MPQALNLSSFVQRQRDGTARIEFALEGIASPSAIAEVEGALAALPGLLRARLNYTNHRVTVDWKGDELDPAAIPELLGSRGYRAHVYRLRDAEDKERRQSQWLLRCLGVAGFGAMNVMLLAVSVWAGNVTDITPETRDFFHWVAAVITIPAVAYAGQPFFRSAIAGIRAGQMNMDVPISIGVLLAVAMSVFETLNHAEHTYFDSALMLLFFLLCGRYLDQAMRQRTRTVAGNLAALRAEIACRLDANGEAVLTPVAALKPGDLVSVRPGDRIPVDGVVREGSSEIDESLITGETLPRAIAAGAAVYAGTLNHGGALTVEVGKAGRDTLLDEIEQLLARASEARSGYVHLADRAARLYSPVVHTMALLTLIGWLALGAGFHYSIIVAISVLIITCPCALALAIPTVQAVSAGTLFRNKVYLNSADALERLARVDTVVFDKTGTLTLPESSIVNLGEIDPDVLEMAARLALGSRHPLSVAIAAHAQDRRAFANTIEEKGEGIRAVVDGREARLGGLGFCGIDAGDHMPDGASLVGFRHGARTAVFRIAQKLRPDAQETIDALKARGLDIRILSGDRAEAVASVAKVLGVTEWRGGSNPAGKIAALEQLKAGGRAVLMVGDGINDAPALSAAAVSMAPVTAADLAQAHSDCVFLGGSLFPVAAAHAVSVKAQRLMHQNLCLTVVYNLLAVPLAVFGYVTPLIAALAMSGSSILVTLNALRARRAASPASRGSAARSRAGWPEEA